jgi:hypothetical protein
MFARSGFTPAATALAHFTLPQAILLWDGQELNLALSERAVAKYFRLKYRICVEEGIPDYNIREASLP